MSHGISGTTKSHKLKRTVFTYGTVSFLFPIAENMNYQFKIAKSD